MSRRCICRRSGWSSVEGCLFTIWRLGRILNFSAHSSESELRAAGVRVEIDFVNDTISVWTPDRVAA
jgi:hypothetical protein